MDQSRRVLRFADWDAVLQDVERLLSGGYQHAHRGNWSLGQNCNHLAIPLESALEGFPQSFPRPLQKLMRFFFLKPMLRHKPTKWRAPAPKFAQQTEPIEDEAGVQRLRTAIARFRQPAMPYHDHPVFGPLSNDEWVEQQLWHCEHHLSFLLPHDNPSGQGDS